MGGRQEIPNEPASGLKKFSYITSNPPFKMDFSSSRDAIGNKWNDTDRFFAGLPNIPNKKKEGMAIYTAFIQHILYSLKPDGKAAVVVPTGFLTAQKIEKGYYHKEEDIFWGIKDNNAKTQETASSGDCTT